VKRIARGACPPGGFRKPVGSLALALLLLLAPRAAFAHDGPPPEPHNLWTAWSAEPLILAALLLSFALFMAGVWRVWKQAGAGRGVTAGQVAAFGAAWVSLWFALVSPLDALSTALFSAHMAQHLLLILVAAPLFVLARPLAAFAWGLPLRPRIALARSPLAHRAARGLRWLALPAVAWTLHALTLWAWHAPALYEWALESDFAHSLEHAAFFGTALLFWSAVFRPAGQGLGYAAAILYVFTMGLQSALLGALITFASAPWYATYATTTAAWGLTPLEDQQLAGAVMWAPAGIVYVVVVVALMAAALRDIERRTEKREARPEGSARPARSEVEGKAAP
jgi:putative membrane protein